MSAFRYLVFETSEGSDGSTSFDVMASATAARLPELQAELATVLNWALQAFAHGRGALEDGADWDYELRGSVERSADEALAFDPGTGRFSRSPAGPELVRHTVSLLITASPAFAEAFSARFIES